MRIYMDTCSLQRPLDAHDHVRAALESEAVLGILALAERGEIELVSSEALLFEISRNPHPARQEHSWQVLSSARTYVSVTPEVEGRARVLVGEGFKPLDSLHLASAEAAHADYLCTCDDRLLRRAAAMPGVVTRVVSPLTLVEELGS